MNNTILYFIVYKVNYFKNNANIIIIKQLITNHTSNINLCHCVYPKIFMYYLPPFSLVDV